jgi:asparagine synthase (glutamine-hydrolysing)
MLDSGIFDSGFLQQIVEQHQSGRRNFSDPIWTLLMFEAFLRKQEKH